MDVKATLLPGVNGTRSLLKEYGDQLVCVRYRYDKLKQKRYKTAEIIVEEKHWHPTYRIVVEPGLEKRLIDKEIPF
ncbi:hypothetical protein ACFL3A_05120 [Pseudomonadota bacterium]